MQSDSQLTLETITSTGQLRDHLAAWDDLWRHSEIALPTKRGAMLLQWLEHFAPQRRFITLVVRQADRWLAALPLLEDSLAKVIRVGKLPVNSWSSAGDLLIDTRVDPQPVLALLAEGIRQLPWPLVWLDTIEIEQPRWQALRRALDSARLPMCQRTQFQLGLIDIDHDWEEYRGRWSKNHRKDVERRLRKARAEGNLRLEVHDDTPPDRAAELMFQGFEVEDRSWKGAKGSSVLRTSGVLEFFQQQARALAEWGQLEVSLLRLDDWPIAFEFGYQSRGVYFSHKVGYDETFHQLSPGQLLVYLALQRYHADSQRRMVNCMGVLDRATSRWCTRMRPIGRMIIGTGGLQSRALSLGYERIWPLARRLLCRRDVYEREPMKLGAVRRSESVEEGMTEGTTASIAAS